MGDEISFAKNLIAKEFEVGLLVVVDGDKDNAAVAEEFLCDAQAFTHKREPFAVAVSVLAIYIAIVINEVFVACVIWRVDVDDVDFACVGVGQRGECFEVVALDKDVVRVVI